MGYRESLYASYVSTHTQALYGRATISGIEAFFPIWKKYFARFLPADRGVPIVDVGCGNGGFVHFLHKMGYTNAEGVDVSPEQVEVSRELGISNVSCTDLEAFLSAHVGAFGVVFARDVIEHLRKEEVFRVLELVRSSLKSGGTLIIQVPNAESPFAGRLRYADFTHEVGFTEASLTQVLRAVGFRQITCYPTGPVSHGFISTIRLVLWKTIEVLLRFYLLVETGSSRGIFTQTLIAVAVRTPE